MSKRVLLIVEGPNDEKVLVEKMWDRFDKNADYKIVTYETNIYVLMKSLFINGDIDEDLDILRLLKSRIFRKISASIKTKDSLTFT